MNSVELSTKNLILRKEVFYSKEKKQQVVKQLVKEILKTASESAQKKTEGVCKTLYRFRPKIDGKRVSMQFELFYTGTFYKDKTVTSGILRTGDKVISVDAAAATKIEELIVGTKTSRNDKSCSPEYLYPLLNGNRFEYITFEKLPALGSQYFSQWDDEKTIYRQKIYPIVLSVVEKLLPKDAKILELCGGDGELAKMLFEKMINKNVSNYFLVDNNYDSLLKADRLRDRRFRLFESDVTTIDYQKMLGGESVDLILGIGALTEQVLPSRDAALKAFRAATDRLKLGGFIILTGLTSSLIVSEDFKDFNVTNSSAPSFFRPGDPDPEFYIAQKVEKPKALWDFPLYEFTTLPQPKFIMPPFSH